MPGREFDGELGKRLPVLGLCGCGIKVILRAPSPLRGLVVFCRASVGGHPRLSAAAAARPIFITAERDDYTDMSPLRG